MPEAQYNPMQLVKRRFFAMRNGVIADTLRRAGSPFRIIFGLNLPQLVDIAADFRGDAALARALWANTTTRESMLLAPMLMPDDGFAVDEARLWVSQVPAHEVADVLCQRLLRRLPYAWTLAEELSASGQPMERYTALRLALNLLHGDPQRALAIAEADPSSPLARQIREEVAFLGEQ